MTSDGNNFKDFLKMLLHIRQIPTTHSLFPTAHFVSKNAILGTD